MPTTHTQSKTAAPRKVLGVVLPPYTMAHEVTLRKLGTYQPATPYKDIFMGEILLAWEVCRRDTKGLEQVHADDRKIAWFIHIFGRLLTYFGGVKFNDRLRWAMWDHINTGRELLGTRGGLE